MRVRRGAAQRRRARSPLPLGVAVLLVAAVAAVGAERAVGVPAPGPAPAPAGPSRPDCAPRIVATGVDTSTTDRFGFVYRSGCGDRVVRRLVFRVVPLGPGGAPVRRARPLTVPGGVLRPGAELAAAGVLWPVDDVRFTGVAVTVADLEAYPVGDYAAWPRLSARAEPTGRPADGETEVVGVLRAEPRGLPTCLAAAVLIVRDRAGRVVRAEERLVSGAPARTPSFSVSAGPGVDLRQARIYPVQQPVTRRPPVPGAPCDRP